MDIAKLFQMALDAPLGWQIVLGIGIAGGGLGAVLAGIASFRRKGPK